MPYFYSNRDFRCSVTRLDQYNAADRFPDILYNSNNFGDINVLGPFIQKMQIFEYFGQFSVFEVL